MGRASFPCLTFPVPLLSQIHGEGLSVTFFHGQQKPPENLAVLRRETSAVTISDAHRASCHGHHDPGPGHDRNHDHGHSRGGYRTDHNRAGHNRDDPNPNDNAGARRRLAGRLGAAADIRSGAAGSTTPPAHTPVANTAPERKPLCETTHRHAPMTRTRFQPQLLTEPTEYLFSYARFDAAPAGPFRNRPSIKANELRCGR